MIDLGARPCQAIGDGARPRWAASGRALSLGLLLAVMTPAGPAFAHASEKAIILLLPTGYYLVGGTAAVAITALLLPILSPDFFAELGRWRRCLVSWPTSIGQVGRAFGTAALVLLILAGFLGERDPLGNPLPLWVWTMFWVALTLAQALLGDLWAGLNPWVWPARALRRLFGLGPEGLCRLPTRLGHLPALVFFFAFAWFELVDLAPEDPDRLAWALLAYSLVTIAALTVFGEANWLARGEPFTLFLGLIARLAPLQLEGENGARRLCLRPPGARLLSDPPLPLGAAALILLALATVSFDGLSATFWWLDLIGINPLEFPGRSAVQIENSVGLLAAWGLLGAAFCGAVMLGRRIAGNASSWRQAIGGFALTLLPISLAYHFAHYLILLAINGQYALLALGDPFASGNNLFGLSDRDLRHAFLTDHSAVEWIWNLQAGAILAGHLLAVLLAHGVAARSFGADRRGIMAQGPLAALMVGYTLFGLWLLAAPTGA